MTFYQCCVSLGRNALHFIAKSNYVKQLNLFRSEITVINDMKSM